MYKLKFVPSAPDTTEKPEVVGSGNTLIAALADLEVNLMAIYGEEAAFQEHCCFARDFESFFDDLAEVGGVFECSDFSSPETAFTIVRQEAADPERQKWERECPAYALEVIADQVSDIREVQDDLVKEWCHQWSTSSGMRAVAERIEARGDDLRDMIQSYMRLWVAPLTLKHKKQL
jgi:hypothetical protein